jgi:hypothetical protein
MNLPRREFLRLGAALRREQLRVSELLFEGLDLFGHLREVVANLVGIVAAPNGRELSAADLGCAG